MLILRRMEETISTLPETTSEASQAPNVPAGPIAQCTIIEYNEPRKLDLSRMSERGQKFFSSCPG